MQSYPAQKTALDNPPPRALVGSMKSDAEDEQKGKGPERVSSAP